MRQHILYLGHFLDDKVSMTVLVSFVPSLKPNPELNHSFYHLLQLIILQCIHFFPNPSHIQWIGCYTEGYKIWKLVLVSLMISVILMDLRFYDQLSDEWEMHAIHRNSGFIFSVWFFLVSQLFHVTYVLFLEIHQGILSRIWKQSIVL